MTSSRRILVVEDERDLAEITVYNLKKAGYSASAVHDGSVALATILAEVPDLIILDLMLPGVPGAEVARQVRTNPKTNRIPILMLTARGEEIDQVAGLAAGADDYVTKPFSMKVVLARVGALLRRTLPPEQVSTLRVGPIAVDLDSHRCTVDGAEVPLTLTEYKLLVALLGAPKRVLSRNDLINRVMGPGVIVTARTVDVHIAAIRKKLGLAGPMVRTIRGVGYQLNTEIPPADEAHNELALNSEPMDD